MLLIPTHHLTPVLSKLYLCQRDARFGNLILDLQHSEIQQNIFMGAYLSFTEKSQNHFSLELFSEVLVNIRPNNNIRRNVKQDAHSSRMYWGTLKK